MDAELAAGMVKVRLRGPQGEIETPWAEQVDANLFRLDNLPWFAYGVSDDDVVEAAATDADGLGRLEDGALVCAHGVETALPQLIDRGVRHVRPVLSRPE